MGKKKKELISTTVKSMTERGGEKPKERAPNRKGYKPVINILHIFLCGETRERGEEVVR